MIAWCSSYSQHSLNSRALDPIAQHSPNPVLAPPEMIRSVATKTAAFGPARISSIDFERSRGLGADREQGVERRVRDPNVIAAEGIVPEVVQGESVGVARR